MTPTWQQIDQTTTELIVALLRRKEIDQMPDGSFTANHRWLIEAVELLLRHQLELREELRNNGIIR